MQLTDILNVLLPGQGTQPRGRHSLAARVTRARRLHAVVTAVRRMI